MPNPVDITNWEQRGLVTSAEAQVILSYSDETLCRMVKDGILVMVGRRYTVASVKRVASGEVAWPPTKRPVALNVPVPPSTRRRRTFGRSETKDNDIGSTNRPKRRRAFDLPG
jgi:hypothetical protein